MNNYKTIIITIHNGQVFIPSINPRLVITNLYLSLLNSLLLTFLTNLQKELECTEIKPIISPPFPPYVIGLKIIKTRKEFQLQFCPNVENKQIQILFNVNDQNRIWSQLQGNSWIEKVINL